MDDIAALGRDGKGKPLVAAIGFALEAGGSSTDVGVSGLAVAIPTYEHNAVVGIAFIEPSGLDTEANDLRVNTPALQVGFGPGCVRIRFGQQQGSGLLLTHDRRQSSRLTGQLLHRLGKGNILDFHQIVQRRVSADTPGEPVPLAVGDLQTVMGSGAVGVATHMNQLIRLIGAQIGQKIHLTGFFYLIW